MRARRAGQRVIGETLISGLALNESWIWHPDFDVAARYVMSPPIRSEAHRFALKQASEGRGILGFGMNTLCGFRVHLTLAPATTACFTMKPLVAATPQYNPQLPPATQQNPGTWPPSLLPLYWFERQALIDRVVQIMHHILFTSTAQKSRWRLVVARA